MIQEKVNYFLIALFDHISTTNVQSESREVRENRVRKSYSWDGIEVRIRVFIKDSQIEMSTGLTSGSPFRYQLTRRETTMNNPVRKDAFRVKFSDSDMAHTTEVKGEWVPSPSPASRFSGRLLLEFLERRARELSRV
jgi:hypothetical protein